MRTIIFKGLDNKEYTLYIEKNKLNNKTMYWFNHNPTMFHTGINQVLRRLKNQTIVSDIGEA